MLGIIGLFSSWRLVLYGGLALGALGWVAYEHHKIYAEGMAAATQQVEKANEQARNAAQSGEESVTSCYDRGAGWSWDRANRLCQYTKPSKPPVRRPHRQPTHSECNHTRWE